MVEAILPLVNRIDQNRTEWVRLMADQKTMKRFAFDVPWIVSEYLNACILASTAAAAEGDPGARAPVSFQYLIDELDHGRYTRRVLPRSRLPTVRSVRHAALALAAALPLPTPRTIRGDSRAGGGGGGRGAGRGKVIVPRGWHQNYCDSEFIPNPRPIQRLRILSG